MYALETNQNATFECFFRLKYFTNGSLSIDNNCGEQKQNNNYQYGETLKIK